METNNQSAIDTNATVLDSWNQERSLEQLRSFVSSRLAVVGEEI